MNKKDNFADLEQIRLKHLEDKIIDALIEFDKDKEMQWISIRIEKVLLETILKSLKKQLNGGWIPFEAEYDRYFKMDMLQGEIPEEEQEIFVTDGENVWVDTFMRDGMECYLDGGSSLVDKVTAWQPLPEPYKEVENE